MIKQDKMVCKNCGNEIYSEKSPSCGLDNHNYIIDWIKATTL